MTETDSEFYRRTMIIPIIEGTLFDTSSENYRGWDEEHISIPFREYSALSQLLDYLAEDCSEFPQELVGVVQTLAGLLASHAEEAMKRLGLLTEEQLP